MAEAEVSIRLACWLASKDAVVGDIDIAIDGAQVAMRKTLHFDLPGFVAKCGWRKEGNSSAWQCHYTSKPFGRFRIHSSSGKGDVVAKLRSGRSLRVECKKGPLMRSKSSEEYPLMREALGQLLTIKEVGDNDLLAIAVPSSDKFDALAQSWRNAPLIKKLGIQILTVDRRGNVNGLCAS